MTETQANKIWFLLGCLCFALLLPFGCGESASHEQVQEGTQVAVDASGSPDTVQQTDQGSIPEETSSLDMPAITDGRPEHKPDPDVVTEPDQESWRATLEKSMREALDRAQTDTDFTILLRTESGHTFSHSTGTSTASTLYESASTSKWVTAAVILNLVKNNVLSLDDKVQDHVQLWPTTGNLSQIKLRHLLSFTSGLVTEPLCVDQKSIPFETCAWRILQENQNIQTPGAEYYYSSTHMQIAGLMAIRAAKKSSWTEVFDDFKANTGLLKQSSYDLPSAQNPRLAGGMHWTATEYMAFLEAIYQKKILTPQLIELMTTDQLGAATIKKSPALEGVKEDWHYGFGAWMECHAPVFNCTSRERVSSPGAYGAYPFIDFKHKYYGILARQGKLGTYTNGYQLFTSMAAQFEQWATTP